MDVHIYIYIYIYMCIRIYIYIYITIDAYAVADPWAVVVHAEDAPAGSEAVARQGKARRGRARKQGSKGARELTKQTTDNQHTHQQQTNPPKQTHNPPSDRGTSRRCCSDERALVAFPRRRFMQCLYGEFTRLARD